MNREQLLLTALARCLDVMQRCEPNVPLEERATDLEWNEAVALARAAIQGD